jgi:hypothetical protein
MNKAPKRDLPDLAREFEKLDKTYSRDELMKAHRRSMLVQLAKAAPDERLHLWNRYLSDLSKWPAWANEMAPIYKELGW